MIGKEILEFYMNHHIQYVYACVFVNQFFLFSTYYLLFNSSGAQTNPYTFDDPEGEIVNQISTVSTANKVLSISVIISLLQGMILAVVRLNEPHYRYLMKREFFSWFGIIESHSERAEVEDIKKKPAF